MTRESLYHVLEGEGLTASIAKKFTDEFFNILFQSISEGRETGIKNFIRFRTRLKSGSVFMNNKSKKKMTVPEHVVIQSRFAKGFREMFVSREKSEGGKP